MTLQMKTMHGIKSKCSNWKLRQIAIAKRDCWNGVGESGRKTNSGSRYVPHFFGNYNVLIPRI
jgi:hypothetical protein